ncbi:MAG: TonB-dependent receptor [Proteobacteria bacterium]|nr:TonB-dependent receptor [Pseudomonadota bacterium]MBU1456874.1 TonB-dependent receptor [Pseudomonadota bacterium]
MKKTARRNTLTLSLVLVLGMSSAALAEEESKPNPDNGDEFLSLYYGNNEQVETASRAPKPLSRVPENVTIITAAQIERMNAHGVDEVLNRVAGISVNYHSQDFNNAAFLNIHDSHTQQVVVYLDGIRISKASDDIAFTNMVPIRIIKRIEVIKGAAGSTWGSALGGVVNIITKDTGETGRPSGSLRGSYGEYNSQDYSGELAGAVGPVGYYLSAARQESDGIKDDKEFANTSVYGKFDIDLPANMTLTVSGGSTAPDYQISHFALPGFDFDEYIDDRSSFASASFDTMMASGLNLHLNTYFLDNNYVLTDTDFNSDIPWWKERDEQETTGISGRLDYSLDRHQLVAGFDYLRNEINRSDELSTAPASQLNEEILAFYANDTMNFGKLTLVPGLRYDRMSDTSDMTSPSLGATWLAAEHTLFRASVSRGFRKPPVYYTDTDNGAWWANDELEPEQVWSYQAGVETGAARFCRIKTTLFYNDVSEAFSWNSTLATYENNGDESRKGIEVEIATLPWNHLSLELNFTYTHTENKDGENGHKRFANLIALYDNPELLTVELSGHYARYGDLDAPPAYNPVDGTVLWDLSISRKIWANAQLSSEIFLVGHNLSNESQYDDELTPNSGRWLEAGLKVFF